MVETSTDEALPGGSKWLLPFGFLMIILLMALVAGIGAVRMDNVNQQMEEIVNQHNVKAGHLMTMYTVSRERSITLLSMVTMDDPFDRDDKFVYFNELGTKFALARIGLSEMELDAQEQALFERQPPLINIAVPLQDRVVELLEIDQFSEAIALLLDTAIPAQDNVLEVIGAMLSYEQEQARKASKAAKESTQTATTSILSLTVVAILLSLGVATFVIRKTHADARALRVARNTLEQRVQERTKELSVAYDDVKEHEAQIEIKNKALESLSNKLSKYLSPQVYASIFSGKQKVQLASHRKKLTIFFSDINGFTEVTDRMESEDLTHVLNRYLTEMSEVALDYGATIDKYIGDGMMIFFGDPESQGIKEDALACVKMAIAMQERLLELADEWRGSGVEPPLTCRIGIHTGYCTVGNFGSEDRMDYTIIGGAVNLASRLEGAADRGSILVSYDTFAHIKDEVTCEEKGPIQVQGLAYPIATYRVVGLRNESKNSQQPIGPEQPSLKLEMDVERMTAEGRAEAAKTLEAALNQLNRERKPS